MQLHERCTRYNALPFPGGVLDQPNELMELIDVCLLAESYAVMSKETSPQTLSAARFLAMLQEPD